MEKKFKIVIVYFIMNSFLFIRTLFLIPHGVCKYIPSCSEYAKESFTQTNFFNAIYLIIKRLIRCNPYSNGGYDPVTVKRNNKKSIINIKRE